MRIRVNIGRIDRRTGAGLALLVGVCCLVPWSPAVAYEDYVPAAGTNLACSICHTCEFPTSTDLCLGKDFCLRDKGADMQGGLPSQHVMVLDDLENVYDPVYFNHEKHAQMAQMSGGCVNCHHFAPASAAHPACKKCHTPEGQRSNIEHSLKAAYHRQCLNCHSEWDTQTHCEWCHRKKVGGMTDAQIAALPDLIHQVPLEVKDLIVFETDYEDGDKVPFHHRNHVDLYDRDCSVCHKNEQCSSCHVHGVDSHPLGLISEVDLHDTCYQCHDEEKGCEECHGRSSTDIFDHASIGWELKPYHKVLQCTECHHGHGMYQANDPRCETCHFEGWNEKHFNHGITGVVLDEIHGEFECTECHVDGVGTASICSDCHDDDREFIPHASFGPGVE